MSKSFTLTPDNASAVFKVIHQAIKQGLTSAPVVVTLGRESDIDKTRAQEKKYHAMIRDIAEQTALFDNKFSAASWKVKLIEQFEFDKKQMGEPLRHPGRALLSLDGLRVVQERASSTKFLVAEGAEFIEYLYSVGAEFEVIWSDPDTVSQYNEYLRQGHLSNAK